MDGLEGALGNRDDGINRYQKTEKKWKWELKSLKKQYKMLFSMAQIYGSRREIKSIKNIKVKESKKSSYSGSNSSGRNLDSDYSQSSDRER